ncbi:MAG: DUF4870 domain-containing protein [Synechococcales cyanobacterium CRU_2_2]|nr:DUF4870 domain-containing protein [Synechococcales cyanobacterium CRU_2_2]
MEGVYDPDKRKLLSAVCHGLLFFNVSLISIGVPIGLLLISDDPVVKENAKESVNMHLNLWVLSGVLAFLYFILIGFLLVPVLVPLFIVANFVLPAWAVYKSLTEPNEVHRYPFIFRLPL